MKSADGPPTERGAAWYTSYGEQVAPSVLELAQRRDGWTPTGWRDRLLQLAERCASANPERAAELRQAAALMSKSIEDHS